MMARKQRARFPDGADRRWNVEPRNDGRNDGHGPQGTALILELQRLRQAFDDDGQPDSRSGGPRRSPRDGRRPPARRSKRKKKGTVERALDICLRPFGLRTVLPEDPGRDMTREIAPPLPNRRSPSISAAPDIEPPSAAKAGRAIATRNATPPTIQINPSRSQLDPSRTQVNAPRTQVNPARLRLPIKLQAETPVGRAIMKASVSLNNGVAFLLNTGDAIDETPGDNLSSRTGRGYERELRTGLRILIAATVVIGGWMTLVPLAGAVVVPGNLVVQSNVKTIQHPTGGVIAEIKVDNGKRVAAGDLLLRLDPTQAQASLQTVSKQLDEVRAKIARLTAERDGLEQPGFPPELTSRMSDDNVRGVVASETSLFKARQNTRQSQKDLLTGRVSQLTEEISGLEAQSASKTKQIELINGELTGVQDLYDKRLVPLTRLTTLQREAARIDGERGQLVSSIAETKSKIGETQLQTVKVDQDFRTDVVKDLGEAQAKEGELIEHSIAARDQLDRIEMRAPTSGVIHQLSVHTIGGVIRAGDTVMEIVPDSDDLEVEAHVQPKDIDHVRKGQEAFVRFSAFNQRTTPQVSGKVIFVSADTSQDQHAPAAAAASGGSTFYTVRIFLSEEERRRLGDIQLIPGMQAEVFMQTGKRTMMSYLLKPITDQLGRAFTEE
jgi:HlyD family secretion protein